MRVFRVRLGDVPGSWIDCKEATINKLNDLEKILKEGKIDYQIEYGNISISKYIEQQRRISDAKNSVLSK